MIVHVVVIFCYTLDLLSDMLHRLDRSVSQYQNIYLTSKSYIGVALEQDIFHLSFIFHKHYTNLKSNYLPYI